MAIPAGGHLTAGALNRLQPVTYSAIATAATANITSTSQIDVPGATVTLVTTTPGATYDVVGTFDVLPGATGAALFFGFLVVDGTNDNGVAIYGLSGTPNRLTVTQTWHGTLAAAGSHTLKLAGGLSQALANGATVRNQNTKISITITEVA